MIVRKYLGKRLVLAEMSIDKPQILILVEPSHFETDSHENIK